jgi:hypothetical protein
MTTITIPKILFGQQKQKLVAVPATAYKEFLTWQKEQSQPRQFKTFTPTAAEKRDLVRARRDYEKGNYITFDELKRELGLGDSKQGS